MKPLFPIPQIKPLGALFLLMQSFDCLTTIVGINMGVIEEANPIQNKMGWEVMIIIKSIIVLIILYGLPIFDKYKTMWVVVVIPGLVVIWNMLNIVVGIYLKIMGL